MDMLWLVEIGEDEFEYDFFVSAAVWGETPEAAEQALRAHMAELTAAGLHGLPRGPETVLVVTPATSTGVVHTHYRAG